MIRPLPLIGLVLTLTLLGGGTYWLTRRTPGAPPQDEAFIPFRAEAVGAGMALQLQSPPTPLRSVRWSRPLPGGATVVQILSQTGRQQVVLVQDGIPGPPITLDCPPGVPPAFFAFADLADAALVPGESLFLLFQGSRAQEEGLLLAWDMKGQGLRAWGRASGDHLELAGDRHSVMIYGAGAPPARWELGSRRTSGPAPVVPLELPAEVTQVLDLRTTHGGHLLVAHSGGLALGREGAWTHQPAPAPSALGLPQGSTTLAGGRRPAWWQPEPGKLLPLDSEGQAGAPVELKALLPDSAALDAPLLRLLGEDAEGQLWFDLAHPSLPPPVPVPAPTPAPVPTDETQAAPEPQAPPVATPAPPQWTREAMEAHLALGLDRLYRWSPKAKAMVKVDWTEVWRTVGAPAGIPRPTGGTGLRPEAGGLLLGPPESPWWLPLKALQLR